MAAWTNLKTLGLVDPLRALEKRNPSYFSRYSGLDDEFGFKLETFARWEPIFRFCYEDYFKVDCRGIENIPENGRAILVGNHSGLLPLDGAMITIAMCNSHKSPRRVRYLVTDWFFTLPRRVGEWVSETGQVRATLENAQKLLDREIGWSLSGRLKRSRKGFSRALSPAGFSPWFCSVGHIDSNPDYSSRHCRW